MNLNQVKKELIKNKEFREEFFKPDVGIQIAVIRSKEGFTQKSLAEKLNTKQTAIARLENSSSIPSLHFVNRVARALGYIVMISFIKEKDYIRNL